VGKQSLRKLSVDSNRGDDFAHIKKEGRVPFFGLHSFFETVGCFGNSFELWFALEV